MIWGILRANSVIVSESMNESINKRGNEGRKRVPSLTKPMMSALGVWIKDVD